MTIGEKLRQYRINSLLTQKHLGELLGLQGRNAEQVVQRWETNKVQIMPRYMRQLHKLVGIPYEDMLPTTSDSDRHSTVQETETD